MKTFLQNIKSHPENNAFETTLQTIEQHYHFTPSEFKNGELNNAANENNGSCKIFAFAQLHGLPTEQTLHCFGDYYRVDVLQNPHNTDHQNIRNFMLSGWSGISFTKTPLTPK